MKGETLMSIKARFRSERDIALITQEVEEKSVLTVENYVKWYTLYIIYPNGEVEEIDNLLKENKDNPLLEKVSDILNDGWYDHCIKPDTFKKIAEVLHLTYDTATIETVERRYQTDKLGRD